MRRWLYWLARLAGVNTVSRKTASSHLNGRLCLSKWTGSSARHVLSSDVIAVVQGVPCLEDQSAWGNDALLWPDCARGLTRPWYT